MARTIRTRISLPRTLVEETEALAARLRMSRDALFTRALEEFVRRRQNRDLLAKLNDAYADSPDRSEQVLQDGMLRLLRARIRRRVGR